MKLRAVADALLDAARLNPEVIRRNVYIGRWVLGMVPRDKSILVYDDDAVSGLEIAYVLRAAGYANVQVTDHFTSALTVLEAKSPVDLLLADIVVPGGLSGIALARMARLRQPDVQVIFVTGYDVPDEERLSWPTLRKPVSGDRLLAAVAGAVGKPVATKAVVPGQ